MIRTFRDPEAERVFARERSRHLSPELQRAAYKKLAILHAAGSIQDLRVPPGNRLEKLSGERAGQHSLRINERWRICFVWRDGDAYDVEIVDYLWKEVEMVARKLAPVHPGKILMEEFLEPLGISQYRLAKDTGVPPRRINEIVHGKRAISADTALRLARYFGMSETFWQNLQAHYDLEIQKDRLGERLEKEVAVYARVS